NEFALSFQPNFVNNPGTLRFDIDGTRPFKSVYSDSNVWNADQWYHVAAVIDSTEGMMLFIDGIKQASTHPNTEATASVSNATVLGTWGEGVGRYFQGSLEDVRFSSAALYSSNFIPSCLDVTAEENTLGLWNFNEATGTIAYDSSGNGFDAILVSTHRSTADVCLDSVILSTSDPEIAPRNLWKVYPNPSRGNFHFTLQGEDLSQFDLIIYNSVGQIISSQHVIGNEVDVNISGEMSGIYFYRIVSEAGTLSGRLLKE
ncbi:MAG TPA: hypothetical protein DCE41_17255, partial [Cytophagales bacterium]|nr:hypothetical protein [Cytophagales bacterium]